MRFDRSQVETAGGDWEAAELCNTELDRLSAQRITEIRVDGDLLRSKLSWKFAVLRQALTYRTVDLAEGTIAAWASGNWISSLIVGRALIHSIVSTTETALLEESINSLNEIAMRETFSARSAASMLDDKFVALNILTAIDRLDKQIPGIRKYYDTLSEFAHPNSSGHYFFYAELDRGKHITTFSKERRNVVRLVISACMAVAWARRRLDEIDAIVPKIADLHQRCGPSGPSMEWRDDERSDQE